MPEPSPRTTCRYAEEFKATAVRLSLLPGVAVGDIAQSFYIHLLMLPPWRKQAREGLIMTKGVTVDKAVAAELKELHQRQALRVQGSCRWAVIALGRSCRL